MVQYLHASNKYLQEGAFTSARRRLPLVSLCACLSSCDDYLSVSSVDSWTTQFITGDAPDIFNAWIGPGEYCCDLFTTWASHMQAQTRPGFTKSLLRMLVPRHSAPVIVARRETTLQMLLARSTAGNCSIA